MLKPHPAYGLDLPKNVTELYGTNGYIVTAYTYTPYGLVSSSGSVTQHIQWSSEFSDTDLGLVYYNYRHYNPIAGRWTGRDLLQESQGFNVYYAYLNNSMVYYDYIGLDVVIIIGSPSLGIDAGQHDQNPWNFLNLGLRRAEHAAKACWNAASNSCCCKVYVVIYKPGYERRTAYDIKRGINGFSPILRRNRKPAAVI